VFHVEFRSGHFRSSRLFNLDQRELASRVVEPWRNGATIEIEARQWPLAETAITIIEAPRLRPEQLSLGRGWSEATRAGEDVTDHWLAAGREPSAAAVGDRRSVVVVHGGDDVARPRIFRRLGELGLVPLDWRVLLEGAREAGGELSGVVTQAFQLGQAVLVCDSGAGAQRDLALVALGIAVASQPRRTVVVAADELDDLLSAVSLEELGGDALVERLTAAGCAVT
jgi:hypothetical protein